MPHCPRRTWQFPASTAPRFFLLTWECSPSHKTESRCHTPNSVANQFCIGRYPAACRLAKNLIQLHDRDGAACDHLAQHRPGSDRRQLVCISDKDQLTARFYRVKQISGKVDIQHRHLIDQNQVGILRFRITVFSVFAGNQPQSLMNCRGREAG